MKLRLGRSAQRDLEHLLNESFQKYGPERAERMRAAWEQAFRFIGDVPSAGSAFEDVRPGLRLHVVRPYAAYYVVGDELIVVRRILHVRQDPNAHL